MKKTALKNKVNAQARTGLYIHIPFCQKKCFFCSFAVCVAKDRRTDEYLDALSAEAAQYRGNMIETVYIGGGTPTLLSHAQLERLCAMIRKNFKVEDNHEWSIETNPDSIDAAKAKLLHRLGFNRISIGAQTMHSAYLKFLGRTHQVKDIQECFDALRQAGFSNINLDMMFGFPGQTRQQLMKDISALTRLQSEHLSIYNLSVENNSLFHRLKLSLPDNHKMAKFYQTIIEDLEKEGFYQYEISNFAKTGKESFHNILYWECQNYIGLGMGAHSHVDGKRFWNHGKLYSYLKEMKANEKAVEGRESLSPQRRLTEAVLFGLRMNQGVSIEKLQKRFDCPISVRQRKQIARFIHNGFFESKNGFLATTLKGRLVLDELCGYLI